MGEKYQNLPLVFFRKSCKYGREEWTKDGSWTKEKDGFSDLIVQIVTQFSKWVKYF